LLDPIRRAELEKGSPNATFASAPASDAPSPAVQEAMRMVDYDRKYAAAIEILKDAANQGLAVGNCDAMRFLECTRSPPTPRRSSIQPWCDVRNW
jgi:hypothetical protein